MTKRTLTKDDTQTLDFDFQSGLEFIGFYVDFPSEDLDSDMTMAMLNECFDKVKNNQIEFPVDDHDDYESLAYILGAVYADCYVSKFNWQVLFFEELKDYCVVSPDDKFAIQFNAVTYKILTGQQETNALLGYNMIKANKFPEVSGSELSFIW